MYEVRISGFKLQFLVKHLLPLMIKVVCFVACCILKTSIANSVDPDQTDPGPFCLPKKKTNLLKNCSRQHFQLQVFCAGS